MLFEGVKIQVVVQEIEAALDAPGRNYGVDRLANDYAELWQGLKVSRRLNGTFCPPKSTTVSADSIFLTSLNLRSSVRPCSTSIRIKSPMASGSLPRIRSIFSVCGVIDPRR